MLLLEKQNSLLTKFRYGDSYVVQLDIIPDSLVIRHLINIWLKSTYTIMIDGRNGIHRLS